MSLCNDGTATTMLVQPASTGTATGNSGNGMGWGGDWSTWIILFLIFAMFGWGGNRWGSGDGGSVPASAMLYDTSAGLQRGFDNQGVMTRLNALQNGIASLGYDQLEQINGINQTVNAGFAGVNNAVCTLGYNNAQLANGIQMQLANEARSLGSSLCQQFNGLQTQIADCCCQTRYDALQNANATQNAINTGFSQTNYNIATQNCDTRNTIQSAARDLAENQNANTRAILDRLTAQEISAKDAQIAAQNQQLFAAQLAASQAKQNEYLINTLRPCPTPSYQVPNPFCCNPAPGYGCGCS